MNYLSAHVTTLYVVQWTLICWAMGIVGYQTLDPGQVLGMMPVMIVATLLAEYALRRLWQMLRRGLSLLRNWAWLGGLPRSDGAG